MASLSATDELIANFALAMTGLLLAGSLAASLYRIVHPLPRLPSRRVSFAVFGLFALAGILILWSWLDNQVNAVSGNVVLLVLVSGGFIQAVYPFFERGPKAPGR